MKINPLTEAMRFVNSVREKADSGGNSRQQRQNGYSNQKKNQNKKEEREATPEEVDAAVQAFEADAQAKANGLHATTEGSGPGLKVVLKDTGGTVVRQFTGEEFLKLRDAAGGDSRTRGKILDQKL